MAVASKWDAEEFVAGSRQHIPTAAPSRFSFIVLSVSDKEARLITVGESIESAFNVDLSSTALTMRPDKRPLPDGGEKWLKSPLVRLLLSGYGIESGDLLV